MVPTTLFKSVPSSSHEQSVPICMKKPVNNTVQAGQLNHVQAGQLNHVKAVNRQKQPVIFSTLAAYLLDYIPLSSDRQMPY